MDRKKRLERFVEFLLVGVIMGVAEDLLAVRLATGEPITLKVMGMVFLVAIPFAAFSELIVDDTDFLEKFRNLL